jgi:hypothetical protein
MFARVGMAGDRRVMSRIVILFLITDFAMTSPI